MKKYLDTYLYDFDESKLGMSYLSGSIQLQDLHIKQEMANRLIDSFGIPLQLKVGLIKSVKIKFSVLSFWTSPLQLEVDEVYMVLGPSTYFRSNDESYIEESQQDLLNQSYDSTNAFNIFEHEMKIKANGGVANKSGSYEENQQKNSVAESEFKVVENIQYFAQTDIFRERLIEEEKQVQNVRLVFKNLELKINRLHIRFEDDYYQQFLGKKFSFGISIDELEIFSSNQDWKLESASDYITKQQSLNVNKRMSQQTFQNFQGNGQQYQRFQIDSQKFPISSQESSNLLIKEAVASRVSIYYDNTGQIIVPSEIIEKAQQDGDPKNVFLHIPISKIKQQMSSVFQEKDQQNNVHDNPRNQYLVVEQFTAQAHIFSYRYVDFKNLYGFLSQKLGDANFSDGKTPRETDRQNWMFGNNQNSGGMSLVNTYKSIQEEQFNYFRNEFQAKFCLSPVPGQATIIVNVTPDLLYGLKCLNDYVDNYYISQDLKQYRPQRKPLTKSMLKNFNKKQITSPQFQRKRRNIVRDWFYLVIWYVRLKRILEQHKASSAPASLLSLMKGTQAQQSLVSGIIKSPIQDPTQLTKIGFKCSFSKIQFKFFESNQRMTEFFSVYNQSQMQRGNNGVQNKILQMQQQYQKAVRLAPLSLNIQNSTFSFDQSIFNMQSSKQVSIKSMDLILTKINFGSPDQLGINKLTENGMSSMVSPKSGVVRVSNASVNTNRLITQDRLDTKGKGIGSGLLNHFNKQNYQQEQFLSLKNISSVNTNFTTKQYQGSFQNQKIGQNQANQGLIQNNFNTQNYIGKWDNDENFGNPNFDRQMTGQKQLYLNGGMQQLDNEFQLPQQEQSVWKNIFNAFKDLFNMNEKQLAEQAALKMHENHDRENMHLRSSMHRIAGGQLINHDSNGNSPHSAVKGRSSMLPNAQLELTRVNQDKQLNPFQAFNQQNSSNKQAPFQKNGQISTRQLANSEFKQINNENQFKNESSVLNQISCQIHSNFSNSLPFEKQLNRYICIKFDENQKYSNGNNSQYCEVIQYPVFKSFLSNENIEDFLFSMVLDINKHQFLKLNCMIDRKIEITYSAQDILEVLLNPSTNGFIQQYYIIFQSLRQQPLFQISEYQNLSTYQSQQQQQALIIDFKPLWLIKKSLNQQINQFKKQILLKDSNNYLSESVHNSHASPSLKKKRGTNPNIVFGDLANFKKNNRDEEQDDGENINDEEVGDLQKTFSFIKCKPSLMQADKSVKDFDENENNSRPNTQIGKNITMTQNMHGQQKKMGMNRQMSQGKFIGNQKEIQKNQMDTTYNAQAYFFDENYLYDVISKYEKDILGPREKNQQIKSFSYDRKLIDIDFQINQSIEIQVLTSENNPKKINNQQQNYVSVCRMRIQPSNIIFQRSQYFSSFQAFGIDFESSNCTKVLQVFCSQLFDSFKRFFNSPLMDGQLKAHQIYERLQFLLNSRLNHKKKQGEGQRNKYINLGLNEINNNMNSTVILQNTQQKTPKQNVSIDQSQFINYQRKSKMQSDIAGRHQQQINSQISQSFQAGSKPPNSANKHLKNAGAVKSTVKQNIQQSHDNKNGQPVGGDIGSVAQARNGDMDDQYILDLDLGEHEDIQLQNQQYEHNNQTVIKQQYFNQNNGTRGSQKSEKSKNKSGVQYQWQTHIPIINNEVSIGTQQDLQSKQNQQILVQIKQTANLTQKITFIKN